MIKNKLILYLSICIFLISVLSGCIKDTGKLPAVAAVSACDTITYNKHIKQIVNDYCLSCHGDNNPSGGFPLTNYTMVKDKADAGKIKLRVIDQVPTSMPPSGNPELTQTQKDLITCWLNNGKKE